MNIGCEYLLVSSNVSPGWKIPELSGGLQLRKSSWGLTTIFTFDYQRVACCEPNVLQNPHVVFGSFPLLLEIVFSCVPRFV